MRAALVCPQCKGKTFVTIPVGKCLAFYTCSKCTNLNKAKKGSCCVICSYSKEKCPCSNKKQVRVKR